MCGRFLSVPPLRVLLAPLPAPLARGGRAGRNAGCLSLLFFCWHFPGCCWPMQDAELLKPVHAASHSACLCYRLSMRELLHPSCAAAATAAAAAAELQPPSARPTCLLFLQASPSLLRFGSQHPGCLAILR